MTASAIPAALAALTDLWHAAGVAGLQVVYGPIYDPQIDFLAVGWDRTDQPAVSATADTTDLEMDGTAEMFDVSSLLSMWSGKSDTRTVAEAVFAAFTVLKAALVDDPTLGGVVDNSWITTYDYTPDEGESGDQVELRFSVHAEAFPT